MTPRLRRQRWGIPGQQRLCGTAIIEFILRHLSVDVIGLPRTVYHATTWLAGKSRVKTCHSGSRRSPGPWRVADPLSKGLDVLRPQRIDRAIEVACGLKYGGDGLGRALQAFAQRVQLALFGDANAPFLPQPGFKYGLAF